jgi:uncharacterized protein
MSARRETSSGHVDIVPRHMGFAFPADTPKYWYGGDPWSTHLLNALSLLFPSGEREFVASVRAVRDRIDDPELLDAIRAFVAQEMHHGAEHDAFNALLRTHGVPVDAIYEHLEREIAAQRGKLSKEADVAITTALEHFTAILAQALLTTPAVTDAIHEDVRTLWVWHAIEETEHKAVAFDVFRAIGGTYRLRVAMMALVTVLFLRDTTLMHFHLLRNDGQLANLRSLGRYLWTFWGPRGHFTKLVPAYLDYYRPDFHPLQHDGAAAIGPFLRVVEARAKRIGPSVRMRGAA